MKKNITIVVGLFLLAILARFLFYSYDGWKMGQKMKLGRVPSVTVGIVQEKNIIKKMEAPARIQSKSRISVVARINGYLTKCYFKEGDVVSQGQVLFEIEPKEWQLAVNKAKANLDNSKAQLKYYEKQLQRSAELVKQDYISKSQYDQALAQRDSYVAQVALNQSAYQDALRNLGYTRVKAPVAGRVGMMNITVGNYVSPSSSELTTIYSENPIYVTFPIDAKDFTELVRVDKTAYVSRQVDLFFSNGEKYDIKGIQNFHDNKIDETTGTITMRATFDNPEGMVINGNYATVYIYSKSKEAVPVVPLTATMENPQGKYVYILDEKGLPQVRTFVSSGQDGNTWIVKSGLKKGDKIILTGLQGVIPGSAVKILENDEKNTKSTTTTINTKEKQEKRN